MKLNDLKISLTQQILQSNDEERLRMVEDIMEGHKPFQLTARQKAELDKDFAAYEAGRGEVYTWEQVKSHARKRKA